MGLREVPVRIPAADAAAQARVNQGEILFGQVACTGCHRQNMTINVPTHVEPAAAVGRASPSTWPRTPRIRSRRLNADGTMTVEIWSDFKRHKMGRRSPTARTSTRSPRTSSSRRRCGHPRHGAVPPRRSCSDAARCDPLQHGDGDDTFSLTKFKALSADDQNKIVEFMLSLGRQEDLDAQAAKVDLSGFILEQQQVIGNTVQFNRCVLADRQGAARWLLDRRAQRDAGQFEAFYCATGGCPAARRSARTWCTSRAGTCSHRSMAPRRSRRSISRVCSWMAGRSRRSRPVSRRSSARVVACRRRSRRAGTSRRPRRQVRRPAGARSTPA